jgi:ABC-type phosphate transport system auxiliary subunit
MRESITFKDLDGSEITVDLSQISLVYIPSAMAIKAAKPYVLIGQAAVYVTRETAEKVVEELEKP